MVEIGFGELGIVSLVALLVTKPEHFPAVVRIFGRRLGSVKESFKRLKAEVKAELQDLTKE